MISVEVEILTINPQSRWSREPILFLQVLHVIIMRESYLRDKNNSDIKLTILCKIFPLILIMTFLGELLIPQLQQVV